MIIRYHREAHRELWAAVDRYDDEHPGIGYDFHEAVTAAESQISDYPDSGPLWPHIDPKLGVRRMVLAGPWPFALAYIVDPGRLVVIAVAHGRRKPGYWLPRLTNMSDLA